MGPGSCLGDSVCQPELEQHKYTIGTDSWEILREIMLYSSVVRLVRGDHERHSRSVANNFTSKVVARICGSDRHPEELPFTCWKRADAPHGRNESFPLIIYLNIKSKNSSSYITSWKLSTLVFWNQQLPQTMENTFTHLGWPTLNKSIT